MQSKIKSFPVHNNITSLVRSIDQKVIYSIYNHSRNRRNSTNSLQLV